MLPDYKYIFYNPNKKAPASKRQTDDPQTSRAAPDRPDDGEGSDPDRDERGKDKSGKQDSLDQRQMNLLDHQVKLSSDI